MWFPLFIFDFFCCRSLQCLISALTQGAKMVTYLGLLVQSCCGEGGTLQTNITGVCGEYSQCPSHTGCAPTHGMRAFLVYTAQATGCPAGELSKVGPGLRALPRSKSLRFIYLGTQQRHRLGWACVLCPSPGPSRSGDRDQVFGECGRSYLLPLLSLLLSFLGVQQDYLLRRILTIQNPKKTWLEMKPACSNLAWRMSGTKKPGGLPSKGLHRVRHD